MRYQALLLLGLLAACSEAPTPVGNQDSAVLTSAIKHFLLQPDSIFGPREGVIVIRATPWQRGFTQDIEKTEAEFRRFEVRAPHDAFVDYMKRNAESRQLPVLGDIGAKTRVDDRYTDVLEASEGLQEHVPTIISARQPGYDRTGKVAIVVFDFTWSLDHGGRAFYVLKWTSSGEWRIADNDVFVAL